LWLRSPDERLASWRTFRIDLQDHYNHYSNDRSKCNRNILLSSLEAISIWWQQAPEVNVAIDPFNSEQWPTVWEIIDSGECCKYSRGLAMAYNMYYMDNSVNITLDRVRDLTYNDEYMIANFDGKYALNSMQRNVIDLNDVDFLEIRESWDIRAYLDQNQY